MSRSFCPPADGRIRRHEIGSVGDVVDLGSKLQGHLLWQIEVLEERKVCAPCVRSVELIIVFVSCCSGGLWRKGIQVDKV